jgi:hypothetical protein
MFKEAAIDGPKDFPVFKKGEKHYFDLLDMNLPLVIAGVEEDLQRARNEVERLRVHKDKSTKEIVDFFERTMASLQIDDLPLEAYLPKPYLTE